MKKLTTLLVLLASFGPLILPAQSNSDSKNCIPCEQKGRAPQRVVTSKKENGKTVMTRPVFPFPKVAVYNGKGDTNLEKNFTGKSQ